MNKRLLYSLMLVVVMLGCSDAGISNPAEYRAWLDDPANGLVQRRTVNGLEISMQYMPPEYRVWRESEGAAGNRDSALLRARQVVVFTLSVGPEEQEVSEEHAALLVKEITRRLGEFGSGFGDVVTLRANGREYRPVLAAVDHDNGMQRRRNIQLVFVDEGNPRALTEAAGYDLVVADVAFSTGVNHFVFTRESIDNRIHLSL